MASVDEKINLLHQKLEHIQQMGGEKQVERQHSRGKLTARERLHLLFDENSFVETGALRKHNCHYFGQKKKDIPADGVVTGYGTVDGRLVFAFAQDFTVSGGSLGEGSRCGGGGRRGHHQPAVLPDPQEDSRHRRAQRSAPRP